MQLSRFWPLSSVLGLKGLRLGDRVCPLPGTSQLGKSPTKFLLFCLRFPVFQSPLVITAHLAEHEKGTETQEKTEQEEERAGNLQSPK